MQYATVRKNANKFNVEKKDTLEDRLLPSK